MPTERTEPLNDSDDEPLAFGRNMADVQRDLDAWVESIPVDDDDE